jgi:hypothetical protein
MTVQEHRIMRLLLRRINVLQEELAQTQEILRAHIERETHPFGRVMDASGEKDGD